MYNESLKQIQMKEQNIIEIDSSEIFMVKEYQEEEEDNIKFDEEGQLVYIFSMLQRTKDIEIKVVILWLKLYFVIFFFLDCNI